MILIAPSDDGQTWWVTCDQHGTCSEEATGMARAIHRVELHTSAEACGHLVYLLAPHRDHEWRIWWFYGDDGELLVGDRATQTLAERLAKTHEKSIKAGT